MSRAALRRKFLRAGDVGVVLVPAVTTPGEGEPGTIARTIAIDAALIPLAGGGVPASFCRMSFSIRPATRADAGLILGFIRALADYEKLTHEVEATEERLCRTLFPEHGRPAAECVLAFLDTEPVGFALFFTTYSTFLAKPGIWLEDLFVKPERRGRGHGKALVLHLAKLANERGCGRLEWSVLDWNQPAIEFYEALGAKRMTQWQICRLTGAALEQYR